MGDYDSDFVPESSGPIGQSFKIATALAIGTGIAIFLVSHVPRATAGAQRSMRIKWEKRNVEIDNAVTEQLNQKKPNG